MSIGQAMTRIHRGMRDKSLRDRLNGSADTEEVFAILESEGLAFDNSEFDEAYHHLLTQCHEEEEAERLKEFKMWWDLLTAMPASENAGRQ